VQDTKNLLVAEHAHRLAVAVYRHTEAFPSSERFGLSSQMRRAAVSIASNIAEGCGRRSNRELLQFLYFATGSASELACQLRIATELGYGDQLSAGKLSDESRRVARMLTRLVAFHRKASVKT
jgi:four helix bundle protein